MKRSGDKKKRRLCQKKYIYINEDLFKISVNLPKNFSIYDKVHISAKLFAIKEKLV